MCTIEYILVAVAYEYSVYCSYIIVQYNWTHFHYDGWYVHTLTDVIIEIAKITLYLINSNHLSYPIATTRATVTIHKNGKQ